MVTKFYCTKVKVKLKTVIWATTIMRQYGRETGKIRDEVFSHTGGPISMSQTNKSGSKGEREQQAFSRVCISRDKHQSPPAVIDYAVKSVFIGTLSVTAVMMI